MWRVRNARGPHRGILHSVRDRARGEEGSRLGVRLWYRGPPAGGEAFDRGARWDSVFVL